MKFELSHDRRNISDEAILHDMKRVSEVIGNPVLRQRDYGEHGKFAIQTAIRRFGSWASAVQRAGLSKSFDRNVTDVQLFDNLLRLWTSLGRQPSYSEVRKPISRYHVATYERRFGSWRGALESFVAFVKQEPDDSTTTVRLGSEDANEIAVATGSTTMDGHTTKRQISERLKVCVLIRDGNKCKLCGVTVTGSDIHFDHIKPWGKGGETTFENIQVLCSKHNLAKGDFYEGT